MLPAQEVQAVEEWVQGPGKVDFFTKTWAPPASKEPVAYLFAHHGFMDHSNRYNALWSQLAARHLIQVFAFDQRGFGQTAFKTGTQGITSLELALEDLHFFLERVSATAKQSNKPLFLFGQSNGGQQVALYNTKRPASKRVPLQGLIVSSPLVDQAPESKASWVSVTAGSIAAAVLPKFKLPVGVDPKQISHDSAVVEAYSKDPLCKPVGSLRGLADMLKEGPKLNTHYISSFPSDLPLLLWHGTADKVTSYEESKKFVELCPSTDKTFKSWEGWYHECFNEASDAPEQVLELLGKWITERLNSTAAAEIPQESHL